MSELIKQRLEKLAQLRAAGINPYPNDFEHNCLSDEFKKTYANRTTFDDCNVESKISGRIMTFRQMGKIAFMTIRDAAGDLQLMIKRDKVGEESYKLLKFFDLGDFIGAAGLPIRTQAGELSLLVSSFKMTCKSIRPLPDKHHGLSDVEERYRSRHLALITDPDVRQMMRARSAIVSSIRNTLDSMGFIEVETPILQDSAGGATAKPFTTYHNTLDQHLSLRIAPELYLKRLVVGGLERIYEVGKNFRNEGVSARHNPEFTSVEVYKAYSSLKEMMSITETLFKNALMAYGKLIGADFVADKFQSDTMANLVGKALDVRTDISGISSASQALKIVEKHNQTVAQMCKRFGVASAEELNKLYESLDGSNPAESRNAALETLYAYFELEVEKTLKTPTFVLDFPIGVSPLARRKDNDPAVAERFELFICGMEVANAFCELNDPIDQRRRFEEQAKLRAQGNDEIPPTDEDFLQALESGMPPTVGLGIGIDRMVMITAGGESIRDVIAFPLQRRRN